jgi:hypothetical protein
MVFLILPLFLFAITPNLDEATTLFRSGLLIVYAIILLIIKPIKLDKTKYFAALFSIITLLYIFSWQFNNQNFDDFLFGAYGRSNGIFTYISLSLIFLITCEHIVKSHQLLFKMLYITIFLSLSYGALQIIGLDPIKWVGTEGVILTLGNPNFSGAFLGILSALPLGYAYEYRDKKRYLNFILFLLIGLVIINTSSSQGFLLYIFTILAIYSYSYKAHFQLGNSNFRKFTYLFIGFFVGTLIFLKLSSSRNKLFQYVESSLQVSDRVELWIYGLSIFKNNILFGTGIGNIQLKGGEYISFQNAKTWGNFNHPDKSHNFIVDNFAEGGIFIGLLTVLYFILVVYILGRVKKVTVLILPQFKLKILVVMSYSYLLQLFFSPSSISIDLLGTITIASVIGIYLNSDKKKSLQYEA